MTDKTVTYHIPDSTCEVRFVQEDTEIVATLARDGFIYETLLTVRYPADWNGLGLKDAKELIEAMPSHQIPARKIDAIKDLRTFSTTVLDEFEPNGKKIAELRRELEQTKARCKTVEADLADTLKDLRERTEALETAQDLSDLVIYTWTERMMVHVAGTTLEVPGNDCTVTALYRGDKQSPVKVKVSYGNELVINVPFYELCMFPSRFSAHHLGTKVI